LLANERVVIGKLILMEVLQRYSSEKDFQRAKSLLTSLTVVDLGGKSLAI